ncbi:MAG: hypothetical protein GY845_36885 [Planctomycetes bacterium]|nr:hypothetical protein [Planctomycetota bacterium]
MKYRRKKIYAVIVVVIIISIFLMSSWMYKGEQSVYVEELVQLREIPSSKNITVLDDSNNLKSLITAIADQNAEENRKDILMADEIKEQLVDVLRLPAKSVPVDRASEEKQMMKFRNFVSASMDLDKAKTRINNRLERVNYYQEVEGDDVPRTLFEKLGPEGKMEIERHNRKGSPTPNDVDKVTLHYHEGINYLEFEREMGEPEALSPLNKEDAIGMVQGYVENVQLLTETDKDRIKDIDVDSANISEELESGNGESREYVVEQSVNYRRSYEGIPVINSSLRVSFQPDSKEITQVAIRYWPPLNEGGEREVKKESSVEQAEMLADEVAKDLELAIRENDISYRKAIVEKMQKVYVQTEDGLKPMLIFGVEYEYTTDENEVFTQPGIVFIDPYEIT